MIYLGSFPNETMVLWVMWEAHVSERIMNLTPSESQVGGRRLQPVSPSEKLCRNWHSCICEVGRKQAAEKHE